MATGASTAWGTGMATVVSMATGAYTGTAMATGVCMAAIGASTALETAMATQGFTPAAMATPSVYGTAKGSAMGAATPAKPSGDVPEMKINPGLASTD